MLAFPTAGQALRSAAPRSDLLDNRGEGWYSTYMTNNELINLHRHCTTTDPVDSGRRTGTTPEGREVASSYRGKGNWDLYLDGSYAGTLWYG